MTNPKVSIILSNSLNMSNFEIGKKGTFLKVVHCKMADTQLSKFNDLRDRELGIHDRNLKFTLVKSEGSRVVV